MIKTKYRASIFLLFLLLIGCKKEFKNEILLSNLIFRTNYYNNEHRKFISQSEIFTVEEIIVLESNENSVFGSSTRIFKREDGFYIFDKEIVKAVFKFDLNGKFIYKINNLGKGPGEFLRPIWVTVDNNDEFLYILDSSTNKMLIFNAQNGSFIGEITNIEYNCISFEVIPGNNGFIFYTGFIPNFDLQKNNELPQFIITDMKGNISSTFKSYNKNNFEQTFVKTPYVFINQRDSLFFVSQFVDTIYSINSNKLISRRYNIDYLNNNMEKTKMYMDKIVYGNKDNYRWKKIVRENSDIFRLMQMLRTEDYVYLSGLYNKKTFYGIYSLNEMNGIKFNQNELEPDIIGNNFLFRFCDNKYFYSLIYPEVILNSSVDMNVCTKIQDILTQIDDKSSPLILKCTIKDVF